MKRFAALFNALDASTSTLAKVDALKRYFAAAAPADAAWAAYFLAGGKPRQVVPTGAMRALACQRAGIDDWLFDECYQAVGDLAETIAHVLPPAVSTSDVGLAEWIEQRLLPLRALAPDAQAERIGAYWDELDGAGRFLLTKLIGGGFRVGVSRLLVQRALAQHAGIDAKVVAQRMMGFTDKGTAPDAASYARLLSTDAEAERDAGQPYPFFLAHSVETALGGAAAAATTDQIATAIAAAGELPPNESATPSAPALSAAPALAAAGAALLDRFDAQLGDPADWLVEWKYDGIRAQIVRRAGGVWIWSRGEELVTDRFPEVVALAKALPDGTVLDGEIVVWKNDAPAPFNLLQQRIGRKTLTKKVLADAPAGFIAYDILEWRGDDLREQPQRQRRRQLEDVAVANGVMVSPQVPLPEGQTGWRALATVREASREHGVEGFMLKHQAARYGVGRRKQAGADTGSGWGWLKWKIDPLSVDAVLIYAQAGHGRRASVYTDYTFAVWNRPPADAAEAQAVVDAIAARRPAEPGALQLVPFAKAYSGLTDAEFTRIDRVIRATTLEKFGPVRSVKPTLVFELGFEGINRSPRHKSGIAVRFPRMLNIRGDKPLHEADTLAALEALLGGSGAAGVGFVAGRGSPPGSPGSESLSSAGPEESNQRRGP